MLLDLGGVHPCDKIFHISCDEERWVFDDVYANTHMSLFDEGDGGLQVLSHTEAHHDARQPPPAE